MNCCDECPGMSEKYLESSKHLDRLFPGSLHEIKFHIFQNITKLPINGLRKFKYNNICELSGKTQYKEKRGKVMVRKRFFSS